MLFYLNNGQNIYAIFLNNYYFICWLLVEIVALENRVPAAILINANFYDIDNKWQYEHYNSVLNSWSQSFSKNTASIDFYKLLLRQYMEP